MYASTSSQGPDFEILTTSPARSTSRPTVTRFSRFLFSVFMFDITSPRSCERATTPSSAKCKVLGSITSPRLRDTSAGHSTPHSDRPRESLSLPLSLVSLARLHALKSHHAWQFGPRQVRTIEYDQCHDSPAQSPRSGPASSPQRSAPASSTPLPQTPFLTLPWAFFKFRDGFVFFV